MALKTINGEVHDVVGIVDSSGAEATGAKITAATIPTGGSGILGWLSAIWYQLTRGIQTAANSLSVAPASDASFVVVSGAGTSANATVAAAGSLSSAIDLGNNRLARIGLPADIGTATILSFQVSPDNATWRDLYDQFGSEYRINNVAASRSYGVDIQLFAGVRYLKLRYGTSASPTTYANERVAVLSLLA